MSLYSSPFAENTECTSGTYLAYLLSASYVVALLGPALASATMSILLWLPFYIGIVMLVTAIWTIRAFPSYNHSSPRADRHDTESLLSSPLLKAQDYPHLLTSISDRFATIKTILTSHPLNFTLLLASFFLTSLASSDTKLLVQYISARYHWTFASAGYLLSGKAVVNFVLLTRVIPRLLRWQNPWHHHFDAYLFYAKVCIAISVLGAVCIAQADTVYLLVPSLLLYALGSALPVFTMSLLRSPAVSPAQAGSEATDAGAEMHVFSIVMLVKTLGSLVGAPLMAGVWMRGIAAGGAGLGYPYFVSAASYAVAFGVISAMRVG